MLRRTKRKQSVKVRLFIYCMIISVTTGVVIAGAIIFSGVFGRLEKNASRNLGSVAQTRVDDISDVFISVSNLTLSMKNKIESKVNEDYKNRDVTVSDILRETPGEAFNILDYAKDVLIDTLKLNVATDIFIVLDSSAYEANKDIDKHAAIYIRSEDTNTYSGDKHGFIQLKGKKIDGIALDNYWSEEWMFYNFDDFCSDFFIKPYEAAKNTNLSDKELGYYTSPGYVIEDRIKTILYSLPLVDEYGQPYGVVGIGLSEAIIKSMLDYTELYYYNNSFYMVYKSDGEYIDSKNITNGYYAIQFMQGDTLQLVDKFDRSYGENMYKLKSDHSNEQAVASVHRLNLYYRGSPFYNEEWYIISAVKMSDLFESSLFLKNILVIDITITFILGTLMALLLTKTFTNPVNRLTKSLDQIHNEYAISLERTGLIEFDILAGSIEDLSAKLLKTANVMMNTIKLTDTNIGIFEIDESKDRVFMTELIFNLFKLPFYEGEYYIDLEKWEKNYVKLFNKNGFIGRMDNIFKTEENRWYQIKKEIIKGNECGLIIDITEDMLEKKKLEYERDVDYLTGLLNRGAFKNRCEEKFADGLKGVGMMIFIDLDNLKFYNDTYGHEYGDMYIQGTADILKQFIRYGFFVSRFAGDEFAVFMHGLESKTEGMEILNDCFNNEELHKFTLPDGNVQKIRYSVGYTWYPDDSDNFNTLMKYADFAMYEIKHSNKGGRKAFDKESYEINSYLLDKSESLSNLIENDMVSYLFQPIIDLKTGEVYGYEALMRSSIDDLKSLPRIFELAKYQAKLYQLEKMTYFNVLRWVKKNKHRLDGKLIFFNSIPNQKLTDDDLTEFDNMFFDCYEHTVTEIVKNDVKTEEYFEAKKVEAHMRGSKIAVDDFCKNHGENLASLSVRPDFIKIDMMLVRNIDTDKNKQRIVAEIIKHYVNTNVKLIAIGVETKNELKYISSIGIDYAQGYYLSEPLEDISDIPKTLTNEIKNLHRNSSASVAVKN